MRSTVRRTTAIATILALGAGTAACGTEDDTDDSANGASATTVSETDESGTAVDSMVGLEVTAVGNVSDVLSNEAMRIDRDGLGSPAEDAGEVGEPLAYDYDYDYYDYPYLVEYDEEIGDDDVVDDGVLVVDSAGLSDYDVDDAVRVSGTVRRFDQDVIESLYEINLEGDVFDDYENSLVLVADSVQPASAQGATASNQS